MKEDFQPPHTDSLPGADGASRDSGQHFLFKLYVTGHTPRSERAIENLRYLCESMLANRYELSVIDVLEQPHLAEQDRVLATPTLIRYVPPPARRVLGDLSDVDQVLLGLDIRVRRGAALQGTPSGPQFDQSRGGL
jgi:circadian clock protein KaiB